MTTPETAKPAADAVPPLHTATVTAASPSDVAVAVVGSTPDHNAAAEEQQPQQHWSGSPLRMVLFKKGSGQDGSPDDKNGSPDDNKDRDPPLDAGERLINAFEKGMQLAMKAQTMTSKGLEDAKNSKTFAKGMAMMERVNERQDQVAEMWDKLAMGLSPFEKEDEKGETPEERRKNKRDLYDKAGIRYFKPATDWAKRDRFYMRNFHLSYRPSIDNMSHIRGTGILDMPKEKQRRNYGPRALVKPRRHYVDYVDSCASVVSRHHFVQEIGEGGLPKSRVEKVLYGLGKLWDSYMLSVHARFLKAAKEGDMVTIEELFAHSSADRDFVDLGDSFNRTPLYWAAANGHVETVKYLLDKGCNPAKADDNQRNAMYWARINKHWDVYKVLKDRNNSEF